MDRDTVFNHVVQAVAHVVFRIPPNNPSIFDEDLVPSKPPPKGLAADRSAWLRTLNNIERELHGMDPRYRGLDLAPVDADATIDEIILEICKYIRDKILNLPEVPAFVEEIIKRADANSND